MESVNVRLCEFNESFRDLSYIWLQDDEVNYLTNAGKQTKEAQLSWFESLKTRNDYLIWGYMYDNIPIGVCGLKNIKESSGEYFGYIGNKMMWGKGLGKLMMMEVERYVQQHTYIHTIFLKVLKDNGRAISLYYKLGYNLIGEDERFLLMNKTIK